MSNSTKTMTKKDLIDRIVAAHKGIKRQDVKVIVQEFLDVMIDELGQGHRLEFRDFGVFEVKKRAARLAQNPKTLEPVPVPPKRTVKFKVGRLMKDRLDAQAEHDDAADRKAEETAEQRAEPVDRRNDQHEPVGTLNGTHQDGSNGVLRLTRHAG